MRKIWDTNWPQIAIFSCLSIGQLIMMLYAFDEPWMVIKGFLFGEILLNASYQDIKTRTIPNWVHVAIILVGLIHVNWMDSIMGLILVPLPFLIVACIKKDSIGGGDIKLVGACGFMMGVVGGVMGSFVGLGLAVITQIIRGSWIRVDIDGRFPFAGYMMIGIVVMLMH